MKYVAVLPFVYKPYRDNCVATMAPEFREHLLEVDNTVTNKGIMASHNIGVDKMIVTHADWLIVLSAAIRFNKGGLDFIERLEQHPDHNVIEAAGVFGWHLIAFSRETIERVGRWDENLWPYSFCDIDMSLRIQKAFDFDLGEGMPKIRWDKVPVDCTDMGMAHGLKLANVEAPAAPKIEYMKKKWDQHPGDSRLTNTFATPFNDPTKSLSWWPTPPDARAINHAGWGL